MIYTYDLTTAVANPPLVNLDRLTLAIEAGIPSVPLQGLVAGGTSLDVHFDGTLTGPQQATLTAILGSHNGTAILPIVEASASTGVQTTSSNGQALAGMVLTPGPGNFRVTFSADVENSTRKGTVEVEIRVNGTAVSGASAAATTYGGSGYTMPVFIQKMITLNATDVLTVYWSVDKGTGTCLTRTFLASSR